MEMTRRRKAAAAALATGVLAAGVIVPAVAQESDEDAETDAEVPSMEDLRAARHAEFTEALADELGLDADTVAAAVDTVRERMRDEMHTQMQERRRAALEQRLADALEEGELTEEQADAIEDAHDSGVLPFREGRAGPGQGRGGLGQGLGGHHDGFRGGGPRGLGGGPGPWTPDDDPDPAA